MRRALSKLAAVVALLALLAPGVSTLAETLSTGNLSPCCNTVYCPMHHRQTRNLQNDKSDCGSMGTTGQNGYSMRACDTAPNPAVGTAVFVLTAPVTLRGPAFAESTLLLATREFLSVATIPPIPPPRIIPS